MREVGVFFWMLSGWALTLSAQTPPAPLLPTQYIVRSWDVTDGLPPGGVQAIVQDQNGYLLLRTAEGLLRFDGLRFTFLSVSPRTPPAPLEIESNDTLVPLADLVDGKILSFATDHEGTLWVGTDTGLASLRVNPFTHLGENEGVVSDSVNAAFLDHKGTLWIGSTGGLDRLSPDGTLARYVTPELPTRGVWPLGEDAQGRLFFSSMQKNLVLDGGTVRRLDFPDRLLCILSTRSGDLWAGTTTGLFRVLDLTPGSVRFEQVSDFQKGTVYALAEGPRGEIWIGSGFGVSRFLDGVVTHLGLGDTLEEDLVQTLHDDGRGNLWIGTLNSGLLRYRDGVFLALSEASGFNLFTVHQIAEDLDGRLWLSSNKGLYRLDPRELTDAAAGHPLAIRPAVFTEADGLRSGDGTGHMQTSGVRDARGRLYFPTVRGLVAVDPSAVDNPVPPPVHVETVLADGERVVHRPLQLRPGTRQLVLSYCGLSFRAAERTLFRYRLVGYDDDWVKAGTRREAVYTHLDPGAYRFEVQAANDSGLWSDPAASLNFELLPALHQRSTFWAVCVLLVLLLAWGVHRRRMSFYLRRNAELSEVRDELLRRTQEVAQRNAAIESFTQALASDFKGPITKLHETLEQAEQGPAPADSASLRNSVVRMRSAVAEIDALLSRLERYKPDDAQNRPLPTTVDGEVPP